MSYLTMLLGENIPHSEQFSGLLNYGSHMVSTGQLTEASKLWDFCFRMAEVNKDPEEKDFVASRTCAMQALDAVTQLDAEVGMPFKILEHWLELQERSLQISTSPQLDSYFTSHLEHIQGIWALRNGDIGTAKAKLAAIEARASSALLPIEPFAATLELELDLAEGATAEELVPVLSTLHQHTGSTCGDALRKAKVGAKLGHHTATDEQLSNILEGKCIIETSEHGVVLAEAQVWQVERLWKSDNAAARQLLTSFQQRWSEADPSIKLKLRADTLSNK